MRPGGCEEMGIRGTTVGRTRSWGARVSLRSPSALTSPIAQFALTGLVAAIVVGVAGTLVVRHRAIEESLSDARNVTLLLARGLQPEFTDRLAAGDPAAVARLDRAVRNQVLYDPVVRVKVWRPDGRIVYSDNPQLIGSVYPLQDDDVEALQTGRIDAELSDLTRPENRSEQAYGKLVEVYMRVNPPRGRPLLFETYLRYSAVAANRQKVFLAFAPAMIASVLLLWLVQLPIAWSLARRLRRSQEERELLLLRAIHASDSERRRIAADLHDTVVQELLGISYGLLAVGERSETAPRSELRDAFRRAAADTRENIRHLRSLLVAIYPPNLQATGLAAALADLLGPLHASGIETEITADPDLRLETAAEELVFRAAQEALRNVVKHAHARHVVVALSSDERHAVLVVQDDGCGYDPDVPALRRSEGHLGIELLADRARTLGGTLSTTAAPGAGTTVRLELPLS